MQRSVFAAVVVVSFAVPATPLAFGGAPVNGFPSWEERVLFEWTNRARCDPQVEMAACGAACADAACYTPAAPLLWDDGTARAARFHADEMRLQGYFAHDSRCTVVSDIASTYPSSCDGSAGCACTGGVLACNPTCTTFSGRLALFTGGSFTATGETLESGVDDPNTAFYVWLYATSSDATCTPSGAKLNRWAILKNDGYVGTGMSGTIGAMDFTNASLRPAVDGIVSGAHYPRQGASVEAWANWYGAAAATGAVVVDGTCTPMTLARGSQTNGAWRAALSGLDPSCHRYYFAIKASSGSLDTYPSIGSFGIGDASCADFSTARPAFGTRCAALGLPCDPAPGACDDGNPCTVDACGPTGCTHVAAPNGTACDDGNACTVSDACQAGVCTSGSPVTCASTGPCTTGVCNPATGSCAYSPVANGTSCSDGDACNGVETCQSGACVAGTPLACDDGNPCTADACDPVTGCTHVAVANGTSCSDGDACNGVETCQSGACAAGTPLACDDGNPCTADACDPAIGCTHVAVADGTSCSDGDACNGVETCQSGACVAGTPLGCDDGNPCTVDACDPATGCMHANAPTTTACSDGVACNGAEHCDGNGACAPGATCQDPAQPSTGSSSGCGCGAGSSASGLVLALLALAAAGPRVRRRRG